MNIVWLSWKDRHHPKAGGAETVSGEIMDRLVRDGHSVKLLTSFYAGSKEKEDVNGIEVVRSGNRYSVYSRARNIFRGELSTWADVVIDEMNTIPFASPYYYKGKNILLSYQLARKVWFYQMPLPISIVGYLVEPLYLRLISKKYAAVLTESESTKNDLLKYGFLDSNVNTFRVGMDLKPINELVAKSNMNMILSLGAIRPMKRTLHAVKAFEIARDENNKDLRMVIAGDASTNYGRKVLNYIKSSRHSEAIDVRGRVSNEERLKLMTEASIILVTSVKEGWGLIVTEANSQGTPAVVYDTDGLRDSVKSSQTGVVVTEGDYVAMGEAILSLLGNLEEYENLRLKAWEWSKEFSFENSYSSFLKASDLIQ